MAKKNLFNNVLVTGAAGFVGANLVRSLLKKGAKVHILQKPSSNLWRLEEIKENLIFHQEPLVDRNKLASLLKNLRPKVIYHLAAHGSYSNQTDVDEMVKTNILGTLNLLLAAKDIPYQCFVNTGSSSEYGLKSTPISESDACQPISFYAATKLSATALCQVFSKIYQKPIVTLRPFSVYGPFEAPGRFIPTIIHCLVDQKPIKLTPGNIRRDFIYIEDLINAYLQTPQMIDKLSGKVLNIGTGEEYANDEVVSTLFKITGKKVAIEKGAYPPRDWDTSHWRANNFQARKSLNWKPQFSLERGLAKMFRWFLKNQSLYQDEKKK